MRWILWAILVWTLYNPEILSQVCINEFLASNVTNDADLQDFDDFSDWIELYNQTAVPYNISGYYFSDDSINLTKWQFPDGAVIPPYGFIRIWADGYDSDKGKTFQRAWVAADGSPIYFTTKDYHTNFKLNRSGESLLLVSPDSTIIDSLSYGFQYDDVSYGRYPDGSDNWAWFHQPSPEDSNQYGLTQLLLSKSPMTLPPGGFYEGSFNIAIDNNSNNTHYTSDGSKPLLSSPKYTEPITIESTSVIRSRLLYNDSLPSTTAASTYFINENTTLPVVSIITPPHLLFNQSKGIYTNRLKDREIPVSLEYFETNQSLAFKMNAGLSLTGQASLFYPQISFTITARDRYGMDEIAYPIFKQRKQNSFKSLYFRNSGVPDHRSTLFRDALQHSLVINKMDIDCQAYQPVLVYINGNYWGIYNLRDKINKEYLSALHQVNPDNIDLLEYESASIPVVKEGDLNSFNALYQFIANNNLADDNNYKQVTDQIDIKAYTNYMISEIFCDNMYWPEQNVRMWRERADSSKWRWIFFDLDYGFGMSNQRSSGYTNNTLAYAMSSNTTGFKAPEWSTLIIRKLLSNNTFKELFIQRFASYLNTVFHSDTVLATINRLQAQLNPEMERHINRWRSGDFYYGYPIQDKNEWEENIWTLKEFAYYRPEYQRQHIRQQFSLTGQFKLHTALSDSAAGTITINEVETVIRDRNGIYFKEVPTMLKAIPKPGFRFVRWEGASLDTISITEVRTQNDSLFIRAVFEPDTVSLLPTHISSDTIITKENSPYYAQGDIIVDPNINLTITEGVTIFMPQDANILVYGSLTVLGENNAPVAVLPTEHAKTWGAICFINATDSSSVNHLKLQGATSGPDYTRDKAAISGYNSTLTINHVEISKSQSPIFVQYGKVRITNNYLTSPSVGDLINVKFADSALVSNCILTGNDKYDSDGIDFDNLKNGTISNNLICNFYGSNSDAIDLGENCKDITIESNTICNVNDKGISIGGASTATIQRNTIANCGQGSGIKDKDSYGYFLHNTFYGNTIGIASFEKNDGKGGGTAHIINTLFANSGNASVWHDNLSQATVSYSLSNVQQLQGSHNIFANPELINEFQLHSTSPAIDGGNPYMPADPDGTLPDIGAKPYDSTATNIIINEIHYNPAEGPEYQFIELYNVGASEVNLDKYELSGAVKHLFSNSSLATGEKALIVKDHSIYSNQSSLIEAWQSGDLNGSLKAIYLRNPEGKIVDFVHYDSYGWWPTESNGQGPSLELFNSRLENMVSDYWRASLTFGGSPGESNSSKSVSGVFINEIMASNSTVITDSQGNFDDWIELYNANDYDINLGGLYLTDNFNNPVKWQIPLHEPESTTIPANGYLLFWADGEPHEGIRHTSFKLDKSGEEIGLVQLIDAKIEYLDSLSFRPQSTDISLGKYPDGSNGYYLFSNPTPGFANEEPNSYKSFFAQRNSLLQVVPNLVKNHAHIYFKTNKKQHIKIYISDIYGRKTDVIANNQLLPGEQMITYNCSHLAPGIYICVMETETGRITQKFIRY